MDIEDNQFVVWQVSTSHVQKVENVWCVSTIQSQISILVVLLGVHNCKKKGNLAHTPNHKQTWSCTTVQSHEYSTAQFCHPFLTLNFCIYFLLQKKKKKTFGCFFLEKYVQLKLGLQWSGAWLDHECENVKILNDELQVRCG